MNSGENFKYVIRHNLWFYYFSNKFNNAFLEEKEKCLHGVLKLFTSQEIKLKNK